MSKLIAPDLRIGSAPAAVLQRGVFHCSLHDPRIRDRRKRCLDRWEVRNAGTTAGFNYLLDAGFRAQTPITAWYIGLINNSGYSAVAAGDTASSHAGWTEFTDYSGSNRLAWSPSAASGGQLVSGSSASFTLTASGNIRGIFIISSQAKSATTGTLWATAVESSGRAVSNGQVLQVYYTNTLTAVS